MLGMDDSSAAGWTADLDDISLGGASGGGDDKLQSHEAKRRDGSIGCRTAIATDPGFDYSRMTTNDCFVPIVSALSDQPAYADQLLIESGDDRVDL